MTNWQVVFKTEKMVRAEIVKSILNEYDIEAVIMNKRDSSYHFGEYEVLVNQDKIFKAIKIIGDEIHFE